MSRQVYESMGMVVSKDRKSAGGTPAENLEWELAKEFGWTPDQVAKIPMKKLQRLLLVGKIKGEIEASKQKTEQWKSQQGTSRSSGQTKKYREV